MSVLVVAPHPDDEVLGVGGTIARFVAAGTPVDVLIATKASPPIFNSTFWEEGRREAAAAHKVLGVRRTLFYDFPAAMLDGVPHFEMNAAFLATMRELKPTTVFVPFPGDIHQDHRLIFDSVMVAVRPVGGNSVREVLAYETLSETNWNAGRDISTSFSPDCFIPLEESHLEAKMSAMRAYASQLKEFPNERSLRSLEALARLRGSTVEVAAAEAFVTIRRIWQG